jgi:hypothetical protein
MLSVVMLSVVMLSVIMLSVVMLSVVVLNVVAPFFSTVSDQEKIYERNLSQIFLELVYSLFVLS